MYDKEVVAAMCKNHFYEYIIINRHFEIVKYSENIFAYCDKELFDASTVVFDVFPEFVGMEEVLNTMFEGVSDTEELPMVFKAPHSYINIHMHQGLSAKSVEHEISACDTLIVLFENITERTKAEQHALQVSNDNLLLLNEIASKNKELALFNQEMQQRVDKEVAKNLEKQRAMELQNRHAQMGEMIAMITHQWKQPLSVIQTVCALLQIKNQKDALDKVFVDEKIKNILNQTRHMTQTVHDFQKFFMPSRDKEVFNIMQTVASMLKLIRMEYEENNIHIELTGDSDIIAYGYANEYTQVLLTILQNAKDALLLKQHQERKINMAVTQKNSHSYVTITDNAGGIPQDIMPQIFTQYMTTKEQGSGIGLYMAKSMIEKNMGGKLQVQNIQNGAQFSIALKCSSF